MKLRELILGMDFAGVEGDEDTDVASLAYDSSRVAPGALFFCVRGQRADGHDSIRVRPSEAFVSQDLSTLFVRVNWR